MAILVTGYRGFIGSVLTKNMNFIGIDVRDGLNLLTCELPKNIDVIYHLAAQSSVENSWNDPVHDMDNIRMTARLVKEYPKARIIYANSAAAQDPKSPYGFSKWASSEYIKRFHTNYAICVFPNVYGPGSRSVVDIFKGQEKVTIFGDGKQTRDYVHVEDIVKGLVQAQNWPVGEYFMGSGIGTNVLELAAGKSVFFAPERKEARESILPNTTPDWDSIIKVKDYIHE